MARRVTVILLALTFTDGISASADVESPLIKKAIAAYEELNYDQAVELLQQALAETLTRDEMIATRRTLGLCHVALDDPEKARADFVELLRLDPGFSLDRSVSPRVRAALDEARVQLSEQERDAVPRDAPLPSLQVEIDPQQPQAAHPLVLRAVYPGGIAERLQLFYRTAGQPVFEWVTARPHEGGRFEVLLPSTAVVAPGLEYYLAVQDELGAPLAGAGTPGSPIAIAVRPLPTAIPIYRRRWFLPAAVGAGIATIAAIVIIAAFAGRSSDTMLTIVPR
jgi:tetratricopeptide (TPR) repeat protein